MLKSVYLRLLNLMMMKKLLFQKTRKGVKNSWINKSKIKLRIIRLKIFKTKRKIKKLKMIQKLNRTKIIK